MTVPRWMIYGAYGYAGRLLAREALSRGHRPLLAGRNSRKLEAVAETFDLECAAFDVADGRAVEAAEVKLVLNAAGPFEETADSLAQGCIAAGASYLDLTAEIASMEAVLARSESAARRGVCVMPGVGFDVIPSDCLACHVCDRVPEAVELQIGIGALTCPSRGTLDSLARILAGGGRVRRRGVLVPTLTGTGIRRLRFADGWRWGVPVPWGDLVAAYHSTGAPNITVYLGVNAAQAALLVALGPTAPALFRSPLMRRIAVRLIGGGVEGPDDELLQSGRSHLWSRAASSDGRSAEAWLETAEGYRLTTVGALECVERILADAPAGFVTPSSAFGSDFVLEIDGSRQLDSLPAHGCDEPL